MSKENIELLKPIYKEWSRGNFRPKFDLYAKDWEWGWSDEFPDTGGVRQDQTGDRLREWLSTWELWRVEPEDYVARKEFVAVLCRYSGRGKGSGVDVETHGAHLWTIRDRKARRLEVFSDRRRALAAGNLDPEGEDIQLSHP